MVWLQFDCTRYRCRSLTLFFVVRWDIAFRLLQIIVDNIFVSITDMVEDSFKIRQLLGAFRTMAIIRLKGAIKVIEESPSEMRFQMMFEKIVFNGERLVALSALLVLSLNLRLLDSLEFSKRCQGQRLLGIFRRPSSTFFGPGFFFDGRLTERNIEARFTVRARWCPQTFIGDGGWVLLLLLLS